MVRLAGFAFDASGGTVDGVLQFIPDERLYAFIHEHDGDLIEV